MVLDRNLECHGQECRIDIPRLINVEYGNVEYGTNGTVYYEYRQVPCTQYSFFDEGKTVAYKQWNRNSNYGNNNEVLGNSTT